MGFEPDARLAVNREVDLRTLPLQPAEFFVLSRIEALGGETSVSDAIAASAQPEAEANKALARLVELGALKVAGAASPRAASARTPSAAQPSSDLRRRASDRRRQLLEAQMRAARGDAADEAKPERARTRTDAPASTPADAEESLPAPRQGHEPAPSTDELRSILDEVEPVAENDPRLEPGAAVDLDRQRRLLALRDRLRHIGHFALLGLEPVDDTKAIRRAYHLVSRQFHPDSFYGKNLGSFHGVLDDLFRRARASYEILLDPQRRQPLVQAHLAQLQAEQARREAASQRARSETERAAAAAERKRQEERDARDATRVQRIRDRAIDQRRRQASKHATQAERERQAGRYGTAATLFRMAHEHDPTNPDYGQAWRDSLAAARRQRAEASYEEGIEAQKSGRKQDAARLLAQAADSDPTLRNLSAATSAVAEVDPAHARALAMSALEVLTQSKARGLQLDPEIVARVHRSCAKAFLAAGQTASAREQAEQAHAIAPSDQTLTLLNSTKLT